MDSLWNPLWTRVLQLSCKKGWRGHREAEVEDDSEVSQDLLAPRGAVVDGVVEARLEAREADRACRWAARARGGDLARVMCDCFMSTPGARLETSCTAKHASRTETALDRSRQTAKHVDRAHTRGNPGKWIRIPGATQENGS